MHFTSCFIVGRGPLSAKHTVLPPKNERKEICFVYMQNLKVTDKITIQICYVFTAGASLTDIHIGAPYK